MQEKKESLWKNCWKNRTLIWRLTKNDFKKRYAGSYLGMVWAMMNPMVAMHTATHMVYFSARSNRS